MKYMVNELVLKASKAWYEDKKICILMEGGLEFKFPVSFNAKFAHASEEQLSSIELICNGTGLHWPMLDEDLSVSGLLEGRFGNQQA